MTGTEKNPNRSHVIGIRVSDSLYHAVNALHRINKQARLSPSRIVADMAAVAFGVDCPEARAWLGLRHSAVASSLERSVDSEFVSEFQRILVDAQQAAIVALSAKRLDESETAAVARFI